MPSKPENSPLRSRRSKKAPATIVAIGASAGGIEAVRTLLENLPPDTGMSFLYVQHLDPHHESILDTILAKATTMKVSQVRRPVRVQPDHLYICPPDKDLVLEKDGRLNLYPREGSHQSHLPIDRLFSSVASSCGNNAFGILLSGNSADGTAGLSAMRSAGATTFAQDATAQFPVMPQSAIKKGLADFVLSPKKIAAMLVPLSKQRTTPATGAGWEDAVIPEDEDALRDIFQQLYNATGIDFSLYKRATIYRRMTRRIRLHQFQTIREYAQFLRLHETETGALSQDLLINVTSFFRSPEAMTYLKRSIFPRILRSKTAGEPIRIWVPACSTGQEVYSIAILLVESLTGKAPARSIQIFASDLSDEVLAKARSGVFSREELKGVSRERLNTFFTKTGNEYRVIKSIRDLCLFSRHNVITEPPFTRVDLVSCSNLLIYLESAVQKKIMATFYFALKPDGYLMLGRSETVGAAQNFFTSINKQFKIYGKVRNASPRAIMEMNYRIPGIQGQTLPMSYKLDKRDIGKERPLEALVDEMLLKAAAPPCVVVNKDMEILLFRGATGPFLEHPAGKASLNLLKMARAGLGFELKNAVHKVSRLKEKYTKDDIEMKTGARTVKTGIEVLPLPEGPAGDLFLILFRENPTHLSPAGGRGLKGKKITELEEELLATREDMRTIVEEQQSINEELQSANEEVLSSNEELHGINEELETSKEEIESTNEELLTINSELQRKNTELAEAQEYSEAIISTIQEAVIVLNTDLSVKLANRTFYTLFRLAPLETEGKPFFGIGERLFGLPELHTLLQTALVEKNELHRFELTHSFKTLGKRSLVFNVRKLNQESLHHQLIFIAIEDITQRVAAEKVVAEQEAWFHNIADQNPALIWVADEHKKRTFFNRTWLDFTGRTFEEEAGDGWTKDIHKDDIKGYLEVYTRSFEKRQPFRHQYRLRRHDGEYRWILATGKPLFSAEGAFSGFLGACNEIHDQRLASEELEKKIAVRTRELTQALDREKDLNEMKSRFVSIASHEFRTPLTAILSSIALLEKYTPEQYAAAGPKHLTRIKTSINILKEILNDFLSVEKLEENKVQVAKEDFDVCEEIKDIEETTRGILKPGQQVVYTHTGEKKVSADKKILRNILINLLSNASKFSGAEKDIRLESRHADGKLVISVADQGIGISKKDQAQLFQRFYRATNAGNVQGTGLGLNIVRRYLDLVGGSITLQSKIGQGTTFTIEIPIPG